MDYNTAGAVESLAGKKMGIVSNFKSVVEDALYLVGIETTGKRARFLEAIARRNMGAELRVLGGEQIPPEIEVSGDTLKGLSSRQAWELYEKWVDRENLRDRMKYLRRKGFGSAHSYH